MTLAFILQECVKEAILEHYGSKIDFVEVVPCQDEKFGHYQCSIAMKMAKELKKNPFSIANELKEKILLQKKFLEILYKVEVASPGFINFTFKPLFLSKKLQMALKDPHVGVELAKKKQKIIVEFSSPNVAKELHVGHLRSTIIGDALARLFEFLGHDVLRLNHIGDWGTQFGMLITYMKEHALEVLQGKKEVDSATLTVWYQEAKKKFDEDENFQKKSYLEVVKLQSEDKSSIDAWKVICKLSRKAFEDIYKLLDVKLIERGESFYNPYLKKIIEDLEKKKMITISGGAKCIFLEGFKNREGKPLPIIIQKSDGGYNYDTTEMASFWHRSMIEKADRIIVVTDAGQSLHFAMIHEAAVKAGFTDPKKTKFDHVPFGLVLNLEGKKFKTREGKTEKLIDLLEEAILHAKAILHERNPSLSEEELLELAKILGIDAVKYADLSIQRIKDYHFSYEKMLKLEGNTAAFLLYAYVRILGIKRKLYLGEEEFFKGDINLEHSSEISLGLHLLRFPEILDTLTNDLLPNRLADYLYELAEKFNGFFRDCRVEGSKEEKERLSLCEVTRRILQKGLMILGMKTLSRM